jgi:PAS domain S-box-containing protein
MLKARLLALLMCIAAATAALALDPRVTLTQYGHRAWLTDDGLPQSTLQAIAQTPDGYIWIGTQNGLVHFDGVHFTAPDNAPRARNLYVFALLVDHRGTLWVGSTGEQSLFTYSDGFLTPVTSIHALGVNSVFSLAAASDGAIWMATNAGVVRRDANGSTRLWSEKDGLPSPTARSIHIDRSGQVWVGTERGLARIENGSVIAAGPELGLPPGAVRSIYHDSRGRLWIGTTQGVFCATNGTARVLPQLSDISTAFVSAILEDSRHNIWFGTNAGLKRLDQNDKTEPVSAERLTGRFVLSLFEDRDHILWAGTFSGIDQFRDTAFRIWGPEQGFRDRGIISLAQGEHGSIWFGTFGGLGRLTPDRRLEWYARPEGLANETVIALAPARHGGVWAGTYGGGVCRVGAGPTRCWGMNEGLSHGVVTSIIEEEDHSLWLGTLGGGIDHFENGRFTSYGTRNGLPSMRVTAISRAREGGLWVGTIGGGAVLFRDGRVVRTIPLSKRNVDVRAFLEDPDGGLWIASTELGLTYVRNNRVTNFPLSHYFIEAGVHAIVEEDGWLWLTTRPAIYRISKDELLQYAHGRIAALHPQHVGAAEGLTLLEFPTGQPSSIVGRDGTMWFNGKRGAAELPAGALENRPQIHPVVRMEAAIVADRPLSGRVPVIDARGVRVTFRYTAIDFSAPNQLRFRYKLEGYDDQWINAGNKRSADYTNLPPGDYAFHVEAAHSDGDWNPAGGAVLRLKRTPEFRETWTFYLLCASLLALIAGLIVKARLRLLHNREKELVARINESTLQLRVAKEAAEHVADMNAELSRKKAMVLMAAGEGIFGLDTHGIATFINPSAARMLDSTVEELVGRPLHDIIHPPSPDRPLPPRDQCLVCSARLDPPMRVSKTDTFLQRSGNTIPVEYTASTMTTENGTRTGVVVTFRDITERQSVERMKSEFVSTVSHELRTPLTSIRGALGLLAGGLLENVSPRVQRMLDIAVNNTDRLVRLINDILDVERIDAGKSELNRKLIDAHDLMTQAADVMMALAERAGVTIVVEPQHATLWVDADRIMQLFTNLLSNAIKFSPRASTVSLSVSTRGGLCTFRVADQGRGIPQDKLETIFERFQQVDASDSRDKGGTGLGLAICRSIVNAHGGRIWAESRDGEGSVLQFTVPLDAAHAAPENPNGRTIVVCEEDRDAMAGIIGIVERQGYRVLVVSSRDRLVESAAVAHPDAILLDLITPPPESWRLLDALQGNDETRETPVIVAASQPPRSVEQYADRIAAWVRKPFVERDVAEALSIACKKPMILVVEDDGDLARVMSTAIQSHGIRTMHAANGRAAIDICRTTLPDLVVLDVILPEMDGFQVVEWLRQNSALRSVPLIVYSALDLGAAQQERLRLGPTAFLTKSRVSIDDFDRQVMRLLNTVTTEVHDAA